ncbi:protein adenylyltransferase Fic [Hyphomicrobium sp.]|jgi:Fic family protein|uniref:protein adenylyltransferase Fic n=1 Tax=Hyphomicrobium sp. TaxID=82 RepID=UPI002CC0C3C8|nr:Fic family protein [Hyphomicrobium sp.]HVZ04941.1 Fic family protein [Hyphomicrobium sp.]
MKAFDPASPYNDLPELPPQSDLETKAVLKKCASVHAALAALKERGRRIPDQTVLINAIPIMEAKDSSAIENIVTTSDALFRDASLNDDSDADPATKEASRYRSALQLGFKTLAQRPISTRTAVDICSELKGVDLDVRSVPGTKLRNTNTGDVIYTPPEGETLLRELLTNWERFLNEATELDPIVRMAVGHYQFEAIHPFIDGNGRTGRVINILFLIEQGLLELPTLYLSRYILANRADYYRLLLDVTTKQAWEPWILYMLDGIESTARWTAAKIGAIYDLIDATVAYVRDTAPKIYTRELVDVIFTQPYSRIHNVVERGLAHREKASRDLKHLVAIGVLREVKVGREKLFLNIRYAELLGSNGNAFDPFAVVEPQAPANKMKKTRAAH